MKAAIIATVINLVMGVAFIGGMIAQQTGASMAAMCVAPFTLVFLGWTLGRLNINISFGERETQQQRPQQRAPNGTARQSGSALARLQRTASEESL